MQKFDKLDITFVALAVVSSGILIWILPSSDKTLVIVVSIFGSVASLFGVAIAIKQLISVRQIAEETRTRLTISVNTADATKAIAITREILGCLEQDKIEAASIRLYDLRELLSQIETTVSLGDTEKKQVVEFIEEIGLVSVKISLAGKRQNFDSSGIVQRLNDFFDFLLRVQSRLKFKS